MKGLVLFLFLVAAFIVFFGGVSMITIRSISGDTIMEAYYHSMGWAIVGFSVFLFSAGLATGMVIEVLERKNRASEVAPEAETAAEKREEKNPEGEKSISISGSKPEGGPKKENQLKGTEVETPTLTCPICGGKLQPENLGNFCPFCGADLRK